MRRHHRRIRGFTLIEMVVVVAIIGIIAALAISSLGGQRRKSSFASAANELQALIHSARQQALADGHDVVVVVFPNFGTRSGGFGRVVVFQDPGSTFFDAASALHLDSYNPASPGFPTPASIDPFVWIYDLPTDMSFSAPPPTMVLQPPLDAVPLNGACTFCTATRGAIRFDERGRASFHSATGPPLAPATGQSLTIWNGDFRQELLIPSTGYRTLVITSGSGSVLTFTNG